MTDEVVLEGDGTADEMEAHLISELRRRRWLTSRVVDLVDVELEPPVEGKGAYRVRIKPPHPVTPRNGAVPWEWR